MSALLWLADGRFPAGGHVHSAGVEAAVADRRVRDVESLRDFVEGRLHTTGLSDAALAAAAHRRLWGADPADSESAAPQTTIAALDAAADARVPSPPLRAASRRQGRQLIRVAGRAWPCALLAACSSARANGLHAAVAWGAVGVAAQIEADDVAALVVHHTITTPAQAAVRLLGLDPFAVAAMIADLGPAGDAVAAAAATAGASADDLDDLPARSGVLVDIASIAHASTDARLFAT